MASAVWREGSETALAFVDIPGNLKPDWQSIWKDPECEAESLKGGTLVSLTDLCGDITCEEMLCSVPALVCSASKNALGLCRNMLMLC